MFLSSKAFVILTLVSNYKQLIAHKMKGPCEAKSVAAKKLKKINTYISTLNVSTMVVLTWHLVYIGQLLQARR
ncbi:hypothetical protein Hanom_Chr07g00594351 [Helianthus anomalus]